MKLPATKPRELIKILQIVGYCESRQTGSHRNFAHPIKPYHVSVPYHNKDLKMGTLRGILKQAGISPEEFMKLRK